MNGKRIIYNAQLILEQAIKEWKTEIKSRAFICPAAHDRPASPVLAQLQDQQKSQEAATVTSMV